MLEILCSYFNEQNLAIPPDQPWSSLHSSGCCCSPSCWRSCLPSPHQPRRMSETVPPSPQTSLALVPRNNSPALVSTQQRIWEGWKAWGRWQSPMGGWHACQPPTYQPPSPSWLSPTPTLHQSSVLGHPSTHSPSLPSLTCPTTAFPAWRRMPSPPSRPPSPPWSYGTTPCLARPPSPGSSPGLTPAPPPSRTSWALSSAWWKTRPWVCLLHCCGWYFGFVFLGGDFERTFRWWRSTPLLSHPPVHLPALAISTTLLRIHKVGNWF